MDSKTFGAKYFEILADRLRPQDTEDSSVVSCRWTPETRIDLYLDLQELFLKHGLSAIRDAQDRRGTRFQTFNFGPMLQEPTSEPPPPAEFTESIKAQLIYADSVVVQDIIFRMSTDVDDASARQHVTYYYAGIHRLRAAVEAGDVIFLPSTYQWDPDAQRRVKAMVTADLEGVIPTGIEAIDGETLSRSGLVMNALHAGTQLGALPMTHWGEGWRHFMRVPGKLRGDKVLDALGNDTGDNRASLSTSANLDIARQARDSGAMPVDILRRLNASEKFWYVRELDARSLAALRKDTAGLREDLRRLLNATRASAATPKDIEAITAMVGESLAKEIESQSKAIESMRRSNAAANVARADAGLGFVRNLSSGKPLTALRDALAAAQAPQPIETAPTLGVFYLAAREKAVADMPLSQRVNERAEKGLTGADLAKGVWEALKEGDDRARRGRI